MLSKLPLSKKGPCFQLPARKDRLGTEIVERQTPTSVYIRTPRVPKTWNASITPHFFKIAAGAGMRFCSAILGQDKEENIRVSTARPDPEKCKK